EKLEIKIILKKFMQAFFVVLGFIIIIIGWLFLIQPRVSTQEIGVFLTIAGVVISFLSLPENSDINPIRINKILFNRIDESGNNIKSGMLDSPVFKAVLVVAVFLLYKTGNYFLTGRGSMVSLIFYGFVIICLFLVLPLFGFPEKSWNNRYFNIAALAALLAALLIA